MPACTCAVDAAPVLRTRSLRTVDSCTRARGFRWAADGRLRSLRISSAGVIPPILDGAPESP
jgi:hypothetical protein